MDSSIPLLNPFTSYSEWNLKMTASLKRRGLYEVSIGIGRESYENENDWLNDGDRAFGAICLALDDSLYYLNLGSTEYPKDLWTKLDRTFGKHNEDHNITLESTPNTTRVLDTKVSASILSDEVVQDEEAKSSTQSIRIEDNLLAVTPSPNALEFYEIYDISSPHSMKRNNKFESLISNKNTSMQTFTSDFPLNSV